MTTYLIKVTRSYHTTNKIKITEEAWNVKDLKDALKKYGFIKIAGAYYTNNNYYMDIINLQDIRKMEGI